MFTHKQVYTYNHWHLDYRQIHLTLDVRSLGCHPPNKHIITEQHNLLRTANYYDICKNKLRGL